MNKREPQEVEALVPPPHLTIRAALTLCGLSDTTLILGQTAAQTVASECFEDDFGLPVDTKWSTMTTAFKALADLTLAQGRINIRPSQMRKIEGFYQWCRNHSILGNDHKLMAFHIRDAISLCTQRNEVDVFKESSKTAKAISPINSRIRTNGRISSHDAKRI